MSDAPRRPHRFKPILLLAGIAGAAVLSLSMTSTFSAFTASITNSANTAASGTVILQEVQLGGSTPPSCLSTDGAANSISVNASTCTSINKYGGSTTLVPSNVAGTTNVSTTNITFKNTGSAAATSFILTPGTCGQSANNVPAGSPTGSAKDFCGKLNVNITSGATTIYKGTAAALGTNGALNIGTLVAIPAAAGATTIPITFAVTLDVSADNTYQGISALQSLVWTLSS